MKKIATLTLVTLFAVALGTANAGSITTYCPGSTAAPLPGDNNYFWVTLQNHGATCTAWGNGNISGDTGGDDWMRDHGWTSLDKDPGTGGLNQDAWFDATTNAFKVYSPAWGAWGSLAVVIKVGTSADPSWAAFTLPSQLFVGDYVSGTWGTDRTEFSHGILYGKDLPPPPPQVPEPASMLLLGTGLLGAGFAARRRNQK